MTDDLVLPVPDLLRATYAVPVPSLPRDPGALLEAALRGLPEPVDELADGLVETGLLTVASHPVSVLPPLTDDVAVMLGATPPQRAWLRAAEHVVVVEARGRPGSAGPLWGSAGVAAALADRLGAPVLDLGGQQVVAPQRLLAALPGADGRVRLVDWVQVLSSPGAGGLWFTTKGLGRFGLPELATECVPPALAGAWGSVLNGLASVLARAWWGLLDDPGHEPAFVTLPARVAVRPADVLRAHGRPSGPSPATGPDGVPVADPHAVVRLRLDPEPDLRADSFLTVVPPAEHAGPVAAWFEQVAEAVLGPPAPSSDQVA